MAVEVKGMSETISIRVRAFAALREALGAAETTITLAPGMDVAGLLARLATIYPDANLPDRRLSVAVNRAYAPPERMLADGDEVALIPPVSGGAGKLFEITDQPLSLDEVAARVTAADRGGITLFAGAVRGVTGAAASAAAGAGAGAAAEITTDHLEYEAYPEMAEAALAEIAAEAQARWPALGAISIAHRVGRLEVGDIAVVIAVAAAHRQDTFDACHYVIDRIKQIAPIWKREVGPNGAAWVEGPEGLGSGY